MYDATLILGSSTTAWDAAEHLAAAGCEPVILAAPADRLGQARYDALDSERKKQVEILPISGDFSCTGSGGGYRLCLKRNGEPVIRQASAVVLADAYVREPTASAWGLKISERVISLSKAGALLSSTTPAEPLASARKVAVLTGLAEESHPVMAEEAMNCALGLMRSPGCQAYLFTGNLKVAQDGLEALYRKVKEAGAVFVKFTGTRPEIRQEGDRTVITYTDEVLREPFRLEPDITIVDETVAPSAFSRNVARMLNLDTGPDGFCQSDNVHRTAVLTNRRGIFVAGPSKCLQSPEYDRTDAAAVALQIFKQNRQEEPSPEGKADITIGRCVRCLTCLRLCPYHAIHVNTKVSVEPHACEGCGICAAECPRGAIRLKWAEGEGIAERIPDISQSFDADGTAFVPLITAFCCGRSADVAGRSAACLGYSIPGGLQTVTVPCAGSVSSEHILTAFRKGADGVVILTCHEGNCHSEKGNQHARRRVEWISELLGHSGFEPERLKCDTLAANMGAAFAERVGAFERKIRKLGPSPLKPDGSRRKYTE